MRDVYVIGTFTTQFTRWPDKTHRQLAAEAVEGVLADAQRPEGIQSIWFGNCALHVFGQTNIRGQVVLQPLVANGVLPPHAPITNVEGGCATGSMAFNGAWKDVASGDAELSLALGVEKTFVPDGAKLKAMFDGGIDQLTPEVWQQRFTQSAEACGRPFEPSPMRIVMLDVCAMQAGWHMKKYGTTVRQLAASAAKNHTHGALNPKAQYQQAMSIDEVLADKAILAPFTRAMCAPISDGAAAALLCSKAYLDTLPAAVRARAVKVAATVLSSGIDRAPDVESVTQVAAKKAYARAGLTPAEVQFAEVHDATSFAEISAVEALGFVAPGEGGAYVESGATALGGARPVNTSGGLVSKGHPLAASGLAMVNELTMQLRGEGGKRQVPNARVGLAHNAGGLSGFDEAVCAVTILTRA